jgi:CBS domain-containing protein/predicted DCC family thiol-disulfide oxidoreductase YuxK
VSPDGEFDVDKLDVDTLQLDDPFGMVQDVMTSNNLRCATPDQPLSSAASKLDKITGLAVVDADNVVVGVVSIKDINRLKKQGVDLEAVIVSQHMSTPPIVVRQQTRIGEAAALMLSRNIHRLPVVDKEGKLIGIVSRTDIFSPLLNEKADVFQALTVLPDFEGKSALTDAFQRSMDEDAADIQLSMDVESTWTVKYLYDGECDMCKQLMSTLKSKDAGQGRIKFVNIASMTYNPREHEGITYEDAMESLHAIKRDGTIMTGPAALQLLYSAVGWGWVSSLMALPLVDKMVDIFYKIVAKYRLPMSGALTAMRRVTLTNEGVEHCVDDEEECGAVDW